MHDARPPRYRCASTVRNNFHHRACNRRMMRPRRVRPAQEPREDSELDELTLARAQRGDRAAQTALVERYQRPVFALLSRMVGRQRALVEDLAQETFLRALRALPRFSAHGPARLSTWIVTIATRLALDHLRRKTPRLEEAAAGGGLPRVLPWPDQDAHRRAVAVALTEAVEALGPPFRAAFLLREVHGLSYEEIAQVLEIDSGTVKSRLARARAALQEALAEMHGG
jgi:RNA polymerase sigma-70 factor, ECF subfamily